MSERGSLRGVARLSRKAVRAFWVAVLLLVGALSGCDVVKPWIDERIRSLPSVKDLRLPGQRATLPVYLLTPTLVGLQPTPATPTATTAGRQYTPTSSPFPTNTPPLMLFATYTPTYTSALLVGPAATHVYGLTRTWATPVRYVDATPQSGPPSDRVPSRPAPGPGDRVPTWTPGPLTYPEHMLPTAVPSATTAATPTTGSTAAATPTATLTPRP